MSEINSDFIEKYQNIYEKDPNSKVFAPLAEAYRRMGLHAQALRVAERGVQVHPHFPSGRVSIAKVYIDLRNFEKAAEHLAIATELAPENLLAFRLFAECHFQLRDAKKALNAYKMVLFLNPRDTKAQKIVKKLESLTADEFPKDLFELDSASFVEKRLEENTAIDDSMRNLERIVSLADAFIARNDLERAHQTLERALNPEHPEIEKRRKILLDRSTENVSTSEEIDPLPPRELLVMKKKISLLRFLLQRFSDRALSV